MGVVVVFVNKFILLNLGTGTKGSVISVLICMVVGVICYAVAIYALKVEEIQAIVKPVLKILKFKK